MLIARVVRHVVSTRKNDAYRGKKLLVVQPLGRDQKPEGDEVVAVDLVAAGVGDLVLLTSEGRFAREIFGAEAPIRSTITAILEGVDWEE